MTAKKAAAAGTLFVAASPLGNLSDMSERLIEALRLADVVLAEDTRRSVKLLSHLDLHKPLLSLHSHNEMARGPELVARLRGGETFVLLSDAGTPAVSDPGAMLVAAAHGAGCRVCPVPGPSALTAALSVSGFSAGRSGVLFVGFLPRHGKERQRVVDQVLHFLGVVVIFESPERLGQTLSTLAAREPERAICLCRELTKVHEEVVVADLQRLSERFAETPARGEVTLVLGPKPEATTEADSASGPHPLTPPVDLKAAVAACIGAGVSAKDTATALAALFAVPKKAAYSLAIAQK